MTIECLHGFWTSDVYEEFPAKCERNFLISQLIQSHWSFNLYWIAICDEPCINGRCFAPNSCVCAKNFAGSQCQYPADKCSPKTKLDFNGGYNCSSSMTEMKCSVFCDVGFPLEFEPEPFYTCKFETGEFLPKNIPHCKYGI